MFGKMFFEFCQESGYDTILRVLGSNVREFLQVRYFFLSSEEFMLGGLSFSVPKHLVSRSIQFYLYSSFHTTCAMQSAFI